MPSGSLAEDPGKVFIVDDDPALCRAMARLFRSTGRDVEVFASAADFLARRPQPTSGCLLLDVNMPGMTGLQLQELVAREGSLLPVIFLTGHGDVPTSVAAMKSGAVDFLLKPVDEALLLRTVSEAIARHAGQRTRRLAQQHVIARFSRLSARETEVLHHIVSGLLNKQAADVMGISIRTVKAHRGNIMKKMEARTIADLVRACESAGIPSLLAALPEDRTKVQ